MELIYYVYQKIDGDKSTWIITCQKMPMCETYTRRKYIGKKAKIEAIAQITDEQMELATPTAVVNSFIGQHFFGKPEWEKYHTLVKQLSEEMVTVNLNYKFEFNISVTLNDNQQIFPDDKRLFFLIKNELNETPISEYKGLKNPIKSIRVLKEVE